MQRGWAVQNWYIFTKFCWLLAAWRLFSFPDLCAADGFEAPTTGVSHRPADGHKINLFGERMVPALDCRSEMAMGSELSKKGTLTCSTARLLTEIILWFSLCLTCSSTRCANFQSLCYHFELRMFFPATVSTVQKQLNGVNKLSLVCKLWTYPAFQHKVPRKAEIGIS